MPGAGKSTVGRLVAKRLRLPFCDTDRLIEQQLGCSITAFFKREGEPAFRAVEAELLAACVARPSLHVIATGGGVVTQPANRSLISARCTAVYLRSRPEDLLARLGTANRRPLLDHPDPLARLRELFVQRDPLYREVAAFTVELHGRSVSAAVDKIAMQLEQSSLSSGVAQP